MVVCEIVMRGFTMQYVELCHHPSRCTCPFQPIIKDIGIGIDADDS